MGQNKWHSSEIWPAETTKNYTLFLNANKDLSQSTPPNESLSYDYDPEDPSPTIGGKTLTPGIDQGPMDQRFEVENRNDAVVFTSEELTTDMEIQGQVKLKLFVGSDKKDSDFMARLTEVYDDGRSMLLGETAVRAHYQNGKSASDTTYLKKGNVYEYELAFDHLANTFKAGHKIRLIITSSNYPKFNRNMNTGDEMYPNTNADTLVNPEIANNSLWFGSQYPSQLTFPTVNYSPDFISEKPEIQKLKIYPNPSNGNFQLDKSLIGANVLVYDMKGKLLIESVKIKSTKLNFTELKSGNYVIKVQKNGNSFRNKLVIE